MVNILRRRVDCGTLGMLCCGIAASAILLFVGYAHAFAEGKPRDAGFHRIKSKHLTLITDLPAQQTVDELPKVFDLAVAEWTRFFRIDAKLLDDWHVVACLIQNEDRFRQHGLLPEDLPPFLHGFQRFDEIWLYEQSSEYYRRHLLLHEGTHAVMNRIFGQVGPAWYREGIAELVGTHNYANGKLELAHFPTVKQGFEHWARIRIVKDQIREGKTRSIPTIVAAQPREFLNVESYAWAWALQAFGYQHPSLRHVFVELQGEMHRSAAGVTPRFLESYHAHKHELDSTWNLFLHHLDYGYDASKEAITHAKVSVPLTAEVASASVDTTKGWQSTGFMVPPGATLDIAAAGQFQVAQDTQPWWCEPQGVTIDYYQGLPLGMLLASVVNPQEDASDEAFTKPVAIGRRGQIQTPKGGTLYLRINERADQLADNQGVIAVKMKLRSAGL